MTRLIEKRQNLHRRLDKHQKQNQQLKFQLGRLQALANIGVSTSMIAHEINNLLANLQTYAELALMNKDDKALVEKTLQKTFNNCQKAAKIMESILAVAGGQSEMKEFFNLKDSIDEIFNCLARDFSKDCIKVSIEVCDDLEVFAVPVQLQQVLMNLILNAREAMLKNGGSLSISAEKVEGEIKIYVTDTGCGISEQDITLIFEPFYTTKKDDKSLSSSGNGLGLAFCKKIIEEHNGTISVESKTDVGTTFEISLPEN